MTAVTEDYDDDCLTIGTMEETQTFDSLNSSPLQASPRTITTIPTEKFFLAETEIAKPPKIINHYLFGNKVGEGSFGKVREVVEEGSLVKRAVKIIDHFALRKNPNGLANIAKEIRVMRRMEHCNVIRLTEAFTIEAKHKTYIVMEYCVGSVEQLIKATYTKYLTEADAHFLFTQLIEGLDYLHSYSVIHNDIKPANLLLTGDFVLKICDFGEAEELSFLQVAEPFVVGNINQENDNISTDRGTPYFKPPEVINGHHEWSGSKVDIFAAGVTLYFMVTGKLPWDAPAQNVIAIFHQICEEDYQIPAGLKLSSNFKQFLSALLMKDPEKRASISEIRKLDWFKSEFSDEYVRFKVTNYEDFYPKSTIKQILEQLYGDGPMHFESEDMSLSYDSRAMFSQSDPDVSPVKHAHPTFTTPRAKSQIHRRPSFFKWFRYNRRE